MKIVGIDPGLDGAVAFIDDGKVQFVVDCPIYTEKKGKKTKRHYDRGGMATILRELKPEMVVVEEAGRRPGQSAQSVYLTGYGHGLWHGIVATLGLPITVVSPQKWQRSLVPRAKKGERKDAALRRACELAPHVEFFSPRSRKMYGRSDAVCIGMWWVMK